MTAESRPDTSSEVAIALGELAVLKTTENASAIEHIATVIETLARPSIAAQAEAGPTKHNYDLMADVVNGIAETAHAAFVRAGIDPGEWDGDDIVNDVKRGIIRGIELLASSAPSHVAATTQEPRECPACWGNGYTAGDSETDKVPCGICAETGKVLPYAVSATLTPTGRDAIIEECALVVESGECLPKCDSYAHEELCPVVNPEAAIRALKSANVDGTTNKEKP